MSLTENYSKQDPDILNGDPIFTSNVISEFGSDKFTIREGAKTRRYLLDEFCTDRHG